MNATVTAADAIPNERIKVGPQQANPVRSAGTAEKTLCVGLTLHCLLALYVYTETAIFVPTRTAMIEPKMMLGIERKTVKKPRDMNPMNSQLKGARSLRINAGQFSKIVIPIVPEPAKLISPVMPK